MSLIDTLASDAAKLVGEGLGLPEGSDVEHVLLALVKRVEGAVPAIATDLLGAVDHQAEPAPPAEPAPASPEAAAVEHVLPGAAIVQQPDPQFAKGAETEAEAVNRLKAERDKLKDELAQLQIHSAAAPTITSEPTP